MWIVTPLWLLCFFNLVNHIFSWLFDFLLIFFLDYLLIISWFLCWFFPFSKKGVRDFLNINLPLGCKTLKRCRVRTGMCNYWYLPYVVSSFKESCIPAFILFVFGLFKLAKCLFSFGSYKNIWESALLILCSCINHLGVSSLALFTTISCDPKIQSRSFDMLKCYWLIDFLTRCI